MEATAEMPKVRIPPALLEEARELAKRHKRSLTREVEILLEEALQRHRRAAESQGERREA